MEQLALTWGPVRKTFTVAELNARIRGLLGDEFDDVWVAGEISGSKTATSGHCYFTLKDQDAQLRCVCFRQSLRYLKFKPHDGMAVLARGHIDVYEARGEYQLLVEAIEPQGHGALQFAFEQLKKKLAAEGLFDPERKRPIPRLPQRIGIVTSPSGAVVRDITEILSRRFPGLHLRIYPALVQGDGSVEAVCRGIEYFSNSGWPQVVIVARGGGSLEDLWTFNDEAVARAIRASAIAVVSAIGHEIDFTIADFAADLRAPTPSAAAELLVPDAAELARGLGRQRQRIEQLLRRSLESAAQRLDHLLARINAQRPQARLARADERLHMLHRRLADRARGGIERRDARVAQMRTRLFAQHPAASLIRRAERAGILGERLRGNVLHGLERRASRLGELARTLHAISPLATLDRGYAILFERESGCVVRSVEQVSPGAPVRARVADGDLTLRVELD